MELLILILGGLSPMAMAFRPNYDGYKMFRLNTGNEDASMFIKEQLQGFDYDIHDSDSLGNLNVAIAPDNLTAFESLGLSASVIHEDLGADITAESGTGNLTYKRTLDHPPGCYSPAASRFWSYPRICPFLVSSLHKSIFHWTRRLWIWLLTRDACLRNISASSKNVAC